MTNIENIGGKKLEPKHIFLVSFRNSLVSFEENPVGRSWQWSLARVLAKSALLRCADPVLF